MNECVVSPPIANYPCTIAFRRDNLNVDTCPDPSSREGSGSETSFTLASFPGRLPLCSLDTHT